MSWFGMSGGKQAQDEIDRLRTAMEERDEQRCREISALREEVSGLRLALELLGGRDLPERSRIEAIERFVGEMNGRRGQTESDVARTHSALVALTQQHKWDIENLEKAVQAITTRMMAKGDAVGA